MTHESTATTMVLALLVVALCLAGCGEHGPGVKPGVAGSELRSGPFHIESERTLDLGGRVWSAALSRDGQRLYVCMSRRGSAVVDLQAGSVVDLSGQGEHRMAVAVAPSGKLIAFGSSQGVVGTR